MAQLGCNVTFPAAIAQADYCVAGGLGHGPSFLCASGELYSTVTVEPSEHVPLMMCVLPVRWIM
jgi:hypothetical protein